MLLRLTLPLLLLASCASQPKPPALLGSKYLKAPIADIEKSAQGGEAQAQFELAEIYEFGLGVTADPKRARALYASAATSGHEPARLMSAFCQQEGLGGPVDRGAALETWMKLHSEGCVRANYALGNFFAYGERPSRQMAEFWYWKGLLAGDGASASALRGLYRQEKDADRRAEKLTRLWETMEKQGFKDLEAMKLTLLTALVKQQSPDVDLLWSLLDDLKEIEFPPTVSSLARHYESQAYERGLGVAMDLERALTLATPEFTIPDEPQRDRIGIRGSLSRLRINLKLGKGDPRQLWFDWDQACWNHPDAESELIELYSRLPPYAQFECSPLSAEFETRLTASLMGAPVPAAVLDALAKKLRADDQHRACLNAANFWFSRYPDRAIPEPGLSLLQKSLLPEDWKRIESKWKGFMACPHPIDHSQRWHQLKFQEMMSTSGFRDYFKPKQNPEPTKP